MATIDYPLNLSTVLMSKSRSQAATFTLYEAKSGAGYVKNTSIDQPVYWDVTFKFSEIDAQRFFAWFRGSLRLGRNTFNMPLRTEFGLVSHVCQFVPNSLLPHSQEGRIHTYTAQIRSEALKLPEGIEENLFFVESENWLYIAEIDYALNVAWGDHTNE